MRWFRSATVRKEHLKKLSEETLQTPLKLIRMIFLPCHVNYLFVLNDEFSFEMFL